MALDAALLARTTARWRCHSRPIPDIATAGGYVNLWPIPTYCEAAPTWTLKVRLKAALNALSDSYRSASAAIATGSATKTFVMQLFSLSALTIFLREDPRRPGHAPSRSQF